jgi:hypothetical protein
MENFNGNPCRHHLFEIFALDKSETDLRVIRAATQAARDRLRFGRLVARDGTEIALTEAELNALEKQLLTPLERLKAEQLVHQAHTFANDPELSRCLGRLAEEDQDPMPGLVADVQAQALRALLKTTPPLPPPSPLADDLPWPPEPEGCPLRRESLTDAVLRDR